MKFFRIFFFIIIFQCITFAMVKVEPSIGGSVYHDGTFESVVDQRFIVDNEIDFVTATKENPIIIRAYFEDGAVLACDIDKINDVNDGVNWVEIETDCTDYGWSKGDVKIRGGKGWNYLEIRIENAPGNNGLKPNIENSAWFKYGSTMTYSGNIESRKCFSESFPNTVLREFNSGVILFFDFSGRVNGEDTFQANDITNFSLKTFQGVTELETEYSPAIHPFAYGGPELLYVSVAKIYSKEGGNIEYEQQLMNMVSLNVISESDYYIDKVTINGEFTPVKDHYTFTEKGVYNIYAEFKKYNITLNHLESSCESGLTPLEVTFNIDATPTDGIEITNYEWDFDNDGLVDLTTETNVANFTFTTMGTFNPTVVVTDSEGGKTPLSFNQIMVSESSPINFPYFSIQTAKLDKFVSSFIVNPFSDILTIDLSGINDLGDIVKSSQQTIGPFGKAELDLNSVKSEGVVKIKGEFDRYSVIYSDWEEGFAKMSAYLLTPLSENLFIPHIAEEVDQWNTMGYVSSLAQVNSTIFTGGNETEVALEGGSLLDLESFIDVGQPEKSWGSISCLGKVLSGFEMFVKSGGDGAAVEMTGEGYVTLYIPHIPEESEIFWTGFAFSNTCSSVYSSLHVEFFTNEGICCFGNDFTIPAGDKIKGLVRNIFPGLPENASWGIITSDFPIVGAEIYGTYDAGICGFSLRDKVFKKGIFPMVIHGENLWTGVSLANIEDRNATVNIKLFSGNGDVKGNFNFTLNAKQKVASVLGDIFPEVDILESDYIKFTSDRSLIAVEAGGDVSRTWMKGLSAIN